ncbi:MAG: transcriptional regulator [Acidobacteria bacterium]|nr:transcriptional regulator [Acidobacteriota bacterium]MBU1473566.1 transcriptional regulator [Acidobacteriota bacterium]
MEKHLAISLSKAIHQKARLGIMSILMASDEAEFNYLKEKLNLTDGNLSSHLSLLEKEKYIRIRKKFIKKKPKTLCRMTEKGRQAFEEYLENLEKIIRSFPPDERRSK